MDGDYFDSSTTLSSQPLPTPSDTPYQTPFIAPSRKSSGRVTPSYAPLTLPPFPSEDFKNLSNGTNARGASNRSSRDLTPDLHAHMVSQIHELRRALESKDVLIDQLESNLADERSTNEDLHEELRRNAREHKSVKKQLASIEESTLTAMEDLCKERDVANASALDLRKKLDASSKQLKAEQDHIDRAHQEWDLERSKFGQEKAQLLRKIELTENRLKAVIEEVTTHQIGDTSFVSGVSDKENVAPLGENMSSLHSSPTKPRKHRRNQSSLSTLNSVRQSRTLNGASLADELDFDEGSSIGGSDDDLSEHEVNSKDRLSRRSGLENTKARKVLGLASNVPEPMHVETNLQRSADVSGDSQAQRDGSMANEEVVVAAQRLMQAITTQEPGKPVNSEIDTIEANQRRKRDPITTSSSKQHARARSEPLWLSDNNQVSSPQLAQSPPASPRSIRSFTTAAGVQMQEPVARAEMVSSSTQTDLPIEQVKNQQRQTLAEPIVLPDVRAIPPTPVEVPSIAIHPPDSGPSSPVETVLPPRTRNVACQTEIVKHVQMCDNGVQTDKIRVDKRSIKLPAHLLPSALKFEDPVTSTTTRSGPIPDESAARRLSPSPSPTDSTYRDIPGFSSSNLNDNYLPETSESSWSQLRKKIMLSNRSTTRPTENDPFIVSEDAMSESDYPQHITSARAMSKRPQKYTRPSFDPPTPVPEDEKVSNSRPQIMRGPASAGSRGSFERPRGTGKSHSFAIASRSKHGVRQPNATASSQRTGSPSSVASSSAWSKNSMPPPPIAIPIRTSSAGLGRKSRKSGESSPSRRSGASSPSKRFDVSRIGKKPGLRKVKSAAPTPSDAPSGSLPYSPLSRASFASADMSPSPIPNSAPLSVQTPVHQRSSSDQTRRLSSFLPTGNATLGSQSEHTVVQAIVATMVGEWMWKYTRKRKSFGKSETVSDAGPGQARHKRWIWIEPHQKMVMWSAKQPVGTKALAGKSGRKRKCISLKLLDHVAHC